MENLVFLTSRFPYPLEKGDKLRAYYHIKYLSNHFNIHLIAINNKKISQEQFSELKQFCKTINVYRQPFLLSLFSMLRSFLYPIPFQVAYFYRPSIKKRINNLIKDLKPSYIHCHLIRMAEYAKNQKDIKKSIDFMDSYSIGMFKRAGHTKFFLKRWFFNYEFKKLKNYENEMMDCFNSYAMISRQDCENFTNPKKDKIIIIPNGVDFSNFIPNEKAQKKYDIGFIGNLSYPPNIEAVLFIAEKVMPLLISEKKDIKFMIAGVNATQKIKSLQSENIDIPGFFENISDAISMCRIILAPMIISIGLQNKILQAMAMKIPTIVTETANNPIGAPDGEAIIVANTPEEFKNAIIELLNNPEKAKMIGENGYHFVKENFEWENQNNKLLALFK